MENTRKRKIVWGVLAGIIAAVIGGVVIYAIVDNWPVTAEPESGDGEFISSKRDKFLVFDNLDFLTAAYNIRISTMVAEDLENYVFSDAEMQYAGENNTQNGSTDVYYDAEIDTGDFQSYDAFTSKFEVGISDGRKYQVILRTDTLEEDFGYAYVAIARVGGNMVAVYADGNNEYEKEFGEFAKGEFGASEVVYAEGGE